MKAWNRFQSSRRRSFEERESESAPQHFHAMPQMLAVIINLGVKPKLCQNPGLQTQGYGREARNRWHFAGWNLGRPR